MGFPGGAVVKNSPASAGDARDTVSIPELGRFLGVGNATPPVFLPGKLHGQRREPGRLHDWAHTHFLNTEIWNLISFDSKFV